MTSNLTRTPLLTLAALALTGTIAIAQQAPPAPAATTPAPQAAPVQRRPPSDRGMRPGMQGGPGMRSNMMRQRSKGPSNFQHSRMMHGGPGGFAGGRGGAMGAGFHIVPPGMWWKNTDIVQKLTLTPEQTKKMDDIFQMSRIQLIDLKANVEKQDVMLEPMLAANPPDTTKTLAQIDKVAQARADLEKANAKMLLGIRGVLTPDQWTKLNTRGSGAPGQPGGGPGGGGPGGGGGRGRGNAPSGGMDFVAPEDQP